MEIACLKVKENNFDCLDSLILAYRSAKDDKKKRMAHLKVVEIAMVLVKKITNSISAQTDLSKEDIIQVGSIGLIKAIELYNPEMNARFATYATHFIKGEIRHYLRDKGSFIKTPREMQELLFKIHLTVKKLNNKGIEDPTYEQISSESGIGLSKIREVLETEYNKSPLSLDQSLFIDNDDVFTLVDKLPAGDYQEDINHYENRIMLSEAIEELPDELKKIIEYSFYNDYNQREIAQKMNLSQMQVSRRLKKALNKLYEIMQSSDNEELENDRE